MAISKVLVRIDGRGYKAYRELLGECEQVDGLRICVTRVQGDPYAPPSVVRVEARIDLPEQYLRYPIPVADWLYRRLYHELRRARTKMGEGHSGYLGVPAPAPIMIRRSGLEVFSDGRVVVRVWAGLPSRRRRILADRAEELLLARLPKAVKRVLSWRQHENKLRRHVEAWIEQEYIRSKLSDLGLVAFIGDGSILPRRCGRCHEPAPNAVPFESPPSLRVEIDLPTGKNVTGMGVRKGLTVIAGSAFHGKTTLLEAIAHGIYNHVPGDGREYVVTIRDAVVVQAEDGRWVNCVDISVFIHDLPQGVDTECFTTSDASGATSTAASIQEAVEAGAKLILIDEDSTATNILYYDERAREITSRHTVTTITELALSMTRNGLSLVIASSGSLPLMAVADTVVVMEDYRPIDATSTAKELSRRYNLEINTAEYRPPRRRIVESIPQLRKPRLRGLRIEDKHLPTPVDLSPNMQLVEETQLNTIIAALKRLKEAVGKPIVDYAMRIAEASRRGEWSLIVGGEPGPGLGEIRHYDILFAVNRLPGLRVTH